MLPSSLPLPPGLSGAPQPSGDQEVAASIGTDSQTGRHRVPGLKALPELLYQPSSALPGLPNGELLNLYLLKPLWVWFSITFSQMHSNRKSV